MGLLSPHIRRLSLPAMQDLGAIGESRLGGRYLGVKLALCINPENHHMRSDLVSDFSYRHLRELEQSMFLLFLKLPIPM